MPSIRTCLTYGLLAASVTGCQSVRSLKDGIAEKIPTGRSRETAVESAAVAAAAEQAETDEEAVEQPSEKPSNDGLEVNTASLRKETPASGSTAEVTPSTETAPAVKTDTAETAGQDPVAEPAIEQKIVAQPEAEPQKSEGRISRFFGIFRGDRDKAKSESSQLTASTTAQTEQPQSETEPTEPTEVALGSTSDTDLLSQQLSELNAASGLTQEVADATAPGKSADEIQQANLALSGHDDAAFDLMSYGDASIPTAELESAVLNVKQTADATVPSSDDLAPWAKPETAKTTVKKAAADAVEEFPWVKEAQEAADVPVATKLIRDAVETAAAPVEKKGAEEVAEAKSKETQPSPTKTVISPEILTLLDEALGDREWRNAGSYHNPADSRELSAEVQQIRQLLLSEDANLRIQGLRRAYERGGDSVAVSPEIVELMSDSDQNVRAHAACTLYHWNQQIDAVTSTLGEVVTSQDQKAVQLAAMYLGDMSRQSETIVPLLETALLSSDGLSALYVSEALLKHKPDHVDAMLRLTHLMRHQDTQVRWLTAHALGSVRGDLKPYAVEALRSGLRDVDDQVRCASALSLGGLGDAPQVVVAELTFISNHGSPEVRDAANIALDCLQNH
ncbi:HEAT repeat domain-containing protein [Rubinisphaera margarita]|uniref:HEAT repeat domain-containing protein n=1 Tax=Rubinisphaera margarita TaxID=2909586 RepID=UPI001EE826FC|nr:HEAT repeat domain-containing protein [Rubinisphaera margarita]MCG6156219.1 HEAT repeat domain-containing protein [Rubinisphaera margarita]